MQRKKKKQAWSIKRNLRKDAAYREKERLKGTESKRNLRTSAEFCSKERKLGLQSKRLSNNKMLHIDEVAFRFHQSIQNGPVYICSCCKRLLYRHSVVHVPSHKYKKFKTNRTLFDSCLTGTRSIDGSEWICKTCHE